MQDEGGNPFGRIADYYRSLVDRYGHHPRACDYGRPESQEAKFRVIASAVHEGTRSLLDVGCGFADFSVFLSSRFPGIEYVGIDISDAMVSKARDLQPD